MANNTLPLGLPTQFKSLPGYSPVPADADTGGYDVMIGGYGFRLATDQQMYYSRATEPTTVHRFDSSLEPGEQSLSPLPWIKSQSSFNGGAGQLNAEQGFTAFQYQAEQVEHIRFDTCMGVDVWTTGQVSRLPSTNIVNVGSISQLVTATVGGIDYAIVGGTHVLSQVEWTSGPDSAPTVTSIDLTPATFGGASNCTISSLVTDGQNYYALILLAVPGSIANVKTLIVKGAVGSTTAPTAIYKGPANNTQVAGVLGWQKARLVAGLGNSMYTLDINPSSPPVDYTTIQARFTHPSPGWTFVAFSESPTAILGGGSVYQQSSILSFELDTTGNVPQLGGGASIAVLPAGELLYSLHCMMSSFLAVGTSKGIRIGSFDTYTGALNLGPLSVDTTSPVLALSGRDRFVYGGFTNGQPDGKTGLVRIDLSFTVDAAGRLAYAPDLRPPYNAPTGLGSVTCVNLLPQSDRMVFMATDGLHVEASAPNANDPAWLRTSRIRYDTLEMKLFKYGRLSGTLDSSSITVEAVTPFSGNFALGTFGFLTDGNPGLFKMPPGLYEWIQMVFTLNGTSGVMNSYEVRAYPAPQVQDVITFTVNCFRDEVDRFGLDVTDPELPRVRWQNVLALKNSGVETRYVEFTNQGPTAELVLIDQLEYRSYARPTIDDDFGGYITMRLRKTTQ